MPSRMPNPRLVKIHRNYSVEEIAGLFGTHRNTVRRWIKTGLPTCDDKRPTLVLGRSLMEFLYTKRTKNKQPCKLGEIYCVRCRTPKTPAGNMAEYQAVNGRTGNLIGICPTCELLINRRVALAKLPAFQALLEITLPLAVLHIEDSHDPCVNSDSRPGQSKHVNTQR